MNSDEIVSSIANRLVKLDWPVDRLAKMLAAAEANHKDAVLAAIDKAITMEELCEGFRLAIKLKTGEAR